MPPKRKKDDASVSSESPDTSVSSVSPKKTKKKKDEIHVLTKEEKEEEFEYQCDLCGKNINEVVRCSQCGDPCCNDCFTNCKHCGTSFCDHCYTISLSTCGFCLDVIDSCDGCFKSNCEGCSSSNRICDDCLEECPKCELNYCPTCFRDCECGNEDVFCYNCFEEWDFNKSHCQDCISKSRPCGECGVVVTEWAYLEKNQIYLCEMCLSNLTDSIV